MTLGPGGGDFGRTNEVSHIGFLCPDTQKHLPGSWGLSGPACLTLLKCPMAPHSSRDLGRLFPASLLSHPTSPCTYQAGLACAPGSLSCVSRIHISEQGTQSHGHSAREYLSQYSPLHTPPPPLPGNRGKLDSCEGRRNGAMSQPPKPVS